MATQQSFEEAVTEYIERSRELVDLEVMENLPPWPPGPYDQSGPPYEAALRLDSKTIRDYALTIGDTNPLFTDSEYGKHTRYGCQIAPGPMLALIRYPSAHGAVRPQGYPVANFISGTAWEFFDVIRVGSRFRSSKITKEFIEREGAQGVLLFLISEVLYWDYHGDLPAKCYGTQIMVPQESMGSSRAMNLDRVGERMMYQRKASEYSPEQIDEIVRQIESQERRGSDTLYWEDVEVGDKLGPLVLAPWTLQDQEAYHFLGYTSSSNEETSGDELAFEMSYQRMRKRPGGARTHPLTRWPWTPGAEHEDHLLAAYRGQPGPFDFGVQRVQIPQQLLTNWIGDEGFIRRMYIALRRPVYYGDTTYYSGEVVKKYKEMQTGEEGPGAVPGEAEYCAVGIRIDGVNQVGEAQAPGTATVYLPSRESGPVRLPLPHLARPPYVNYDTYRRDWY